MNRKEYGGYLELEHFNGKEYHTEHALRFNYARTAWQYLLQERKISKAYLPYYLCDSLIAPTLRNGTKIEYYHIDENFLPLCSHIPEQGEVILIVNYFGLLVPETIQKLAFKYGHIVLDNTQAFFSTAPQSVDTLYSCRKFFGVPDGGYLIAQDIPLPNCEEDRSTQRMTFLSGRLEDGAQPYYQQFRIAEDQAEHMPIRQMSKTTRNLLCGIDYDYVKMRRENNYQRLQERLGAFNRLALPPTSIGPYIYPFYFGGDAAALRAFLIADRVYVPTLWSNVRDLLQGDYLELRLTDRIIPLPLDQRYNSDDMDEIIAIVKKGIERC